MLIRLVDNLYVDSWQWFQLPKILMDHIWYVTHNIWHPSKFWGVSRALQEEKIEGVKQLSQRALWIAKSWNCYKTQNLSFIIKALFSGRLKCSYRKICLTKNYFVKTLFHTVIPKKKKKNAWCVNANILLYNSTKSNIFVTEIFFIYITYVWWTDQLYKSL